MLSTKTPGVELRRLMVALRLLSVSTNAERSEGRSHLVSFRISVVADRRLSARRVSPILQLSRRKVLIRLGNRYF
jgi:hypothetical protein